MVKAAKPVGPARRDAGRSNGGPRPAREPGPGRRWLEKLVDPGSLVEIDLIGAAGRPVAGFGAIEGRQVALCWLGIALREPDTVTLIKVQELALRSLVPIVLIEPGGERVHDDIPARAGFAQVLRMAARSSGVVPQLTVLVGPPAREGRLAASLSDFTVAIGEAAAAPSPAPDFEVAADAQAVLTVRRLLAFLPSSHAAGPPAGPAPDRASQPDPMLQEIVPVDGHSPYDMLDVVERVVDGGDFLEIQKRNGSGIVAGFGRLGGHPIGVVGGRGGGQLDGVTLVKAARFVRFCDAFGIPVVTFVDATGFDDPIQAAKLIYAYAEATVPKLAVLVRRQRGVAFQLMSPWLAGSDICLAWPTAEIAEAAAERGYVDDLIEPRLTRPMLLRGLELCLRKVEERPAHKHGNEPL